MYGMMYGIPIYEGDFKWSFSWSLNGLVEGILMVY